MKVIKFKGIDSFNQPIFISVESPKYFYGSTDILFGYHSTEEEVLSKITEEDLCYFGSSFDCEPMGTPAGHIKIQRPEAATATTTATRVVEQTDKKVPFALPWKMVERRYVFAIVDANGDDVTHFSKNLLSYRSIISTDTIKEIDKPVRECAEMIVRCCNNHRDTDKYSADEALAIADGLMEGDAMAAAKTLAVQARFYFKEYEALRKAMASMGTRTSKGE